MTEDYFRYDLTKREVDVLNTALAVARPHVRPALARDMRDVRRKLLNCPTTHDPAAHPWPPPGAQPDTEAVAADVAGNDKEK